MTPVNRPKDFFSNCESIHCVQKLKNKKKFPLNSVEILLETQSLVVIFEVREDYGCADVYFYRTVQIHVWKINWLLKIVSWHSGGSGDGRREVGWGEEVFLQCFQSVLRHCFCGPHSLTSVFLWKPDSAESVSLNIFGAVLPNSSFFFFFSKMVFKAISSFQWKLLLYMKDKMELKWTSGRFSCFSKRKKKIAPFL